jgi:general secretion pathway protein L
MSGGRYLLLFLSDARPGWLRLEDGFVAERGDAGSPPPPPEDVADRHRVVAVVPAEDVAVHWVDLPMLAPAQAAAAARLLAAEASAEPLERLHVAIDNKRGGEAGLRAMAIVSTARMSEWLDQAAALGHDPDHVLPKSLLIDPPETGLRRLRGGGLDIVRGPTAAFAAEPDLVSVAAAGEPIETIENAAFEAALADVLATAPLDLRQGAFARRRRRRVDWRLVRRLALLGAAVVAVTLLIQLTLIMRYSFAADRLEGEAEAVARRALPRAAAIANAPAQLSERLSALRGGGAGFGATAAAAFAAVRDTPNVDLGSLRFDRDGSLQLSVLAGGAGDIAALQQRLAAAGFLVSAGAARPGGGRQVADLTVRAP